MNVLDPLREKLWAKTAESWSHLRDKKIFVTGGTGFFGKSFLDLYQYYRETRGLSARITILSRDPEKFKTHYPHLADGIDFVQGRVEDLHTTGEKYDHVFHMATPAELKFISEQPVEIFETIYFGQKQVLEFARAASAKSVLFTSSGAVYGRRPFGSPAVTEDCLECPEPDGPGAAYGEGKRVAELFGNLWSRKTGIPFLTARCFAFMGPHLNFASGHAAGTFVHQAVHGGPIQMANGQSLRSFLYSDDLVGWLLTILAEGESCHPYNVGSDQVVSIHELAQAVQRVVRPECAIADNTKSSSVLTTQYFPNVERARKLGLDSWTPLDEAIARTAAGCKK